MARHSYRAGRSPRPTSRGAEPFHNLCQWLLVLLELTSSSPIDIRLKPLLHIGLVHPTLGVSEQPLTAQFSSGKGKGLGVAPLGWTVKCRSAAVGWESAAAACLSWPYSAGTEANLGPGAIRRRPQFPWRRLCAELGWRGREFKGVA